MVRRESIARIFVRSGKPLLQWSIDAALAAGCVDLVVVSTDDPEIAELARLVALLFPFFVLLSLPPIPLLESRRCFMPLS